MCRRLLANPVMETATLGAARRRAAGRRAGEPVTIDRAAGRASRSPSSRAPGRSGTSPTSPTAVLGWEAQLVWHTETGARRAPTPSSCPADSRTATTCAPAPSRASRRSCASVEAFAAAGGPVIGSCNGFQVLTEAGLLPGALTRNDHLEFRCDWQWLRVERPRAAPAVAGRPRRRRPHPPADQPRRGALRGRRRHPRRARARRTRGAALRRRRRPGHARRPTRTARSAGSPASSTSAATCSGLMPHPERAAEEEVGGTDGLRLFRSLERWLQDQPAAAERRL